MARHDDMELLTPLTWYEVKVDDGAAAIGNHQLEVLGLMYNWTEEFSENENGPAQQVMELIPHHYQTEEDCERAFMIAGVNQGMSTRVEWPDHDKPPKLTDVWPSEEQAETPPPEIMWPGPETTVKFDFGDGAPAGVTHGLYLQALLKLPFVRVITLYQYRDRDGRLGITFSTADPDNEKILCNLSEVRTLSRLPGAVITRGI